MQYKSVLQLSLITLSLGVLYETANSQKQIQMEIRKLTDAIRKSPNLSSGRVKNKGAILARVHSHGSGQEEEEFQESTLEREILDWRRTADEVATAVSLNGYDGVSIDTQSIPSVSVDTLPIYEEDKYDPEPDCPDMQSGEILKCQIDANQNIVKELEQCGIFSQAASYQKQGIKLMKLLEVQDPSQPNDASCEELTKMREKSADILSKCDSVESDLEAKTVLQELLNEEVNRQPDQIDVYRRARLYHKLGDLYFKQGNIAQARKFLIRALEGRKRIDPMPHPLVGESAELLVQILKQDHALDEARGLREWIRQNLDIAMPSSASQITHDTTNNNAGTDLTSVYQWCKQQGSKYNLSMHDAFRG